VVDTSLGRVASVAAATWRGCFAGFRALGLLAVGLLLPILVGAIASANFPDFDLLATTESLYSTLFLPILLLLVTLVLGVGLFRTEIEEDTLVYPMSRSVPRGALVLGKYVGFSGAALLLLLPSVIVAASIAAGLGRGPTVATGSLFEALVLVTALAVLAYGAFFLFLGLLTRHALVIGLLFGFIWETFVPLLPGPLKELTLVYYLRTVGARLVTAGPLSVAPGPVSLAAAIAVPIVFSIVAGALATLYLRVAEARPAAAPA